MTSTTPGSLPKLSVILDDKRSDAFDYNPARTWTTRAADHWFSGTVSSLAAVTNSTDSRKGGIRMTFNGTSVAFIGSTPPSSLSQFFTVSIDGSTPFNTSYSDPNPPTYRQWYQSPTLPDGLHTITLSNLSSATTLDFATVEVGKETSLAKEIMIVDNDDSLQNGGIKFSTERGSTWRNNRNKFNLAGFGNGFAYGNSTHDSSYVGSSFTFRFSGTTVAIYGIYDFSNLGKLTLSFTIDSQSLLQTFQVTPTTPQFINEQGQEPNFKFYSYDFLTAGEHTLVVNITECVNQTFRFDYLTYVPAFGTVSDMPADLLNWAAGGSGSGQGGGSKTGVIVGSVLGALATGSVLLGVLLLFFLRRRKSTRRAKELEQSNIEYLPCECRCIDSTSSAQLENNTVDTTEPNTNNAAIDRSSQPPSAWRTTMTPSQHFDFTNIDPTSPDGTSNRSAVQYGLNLTHANPTGAGGVARPVSPMRAADVIPSTEMEMEPPSYDEATVGHRK